MNPCPCGNYGSRIKECKCTPSQISRYLSRISGPLLDRIDIQIEAEEVTYSQIRQEQEEESSQSIKYPASFGKFFIPTDKMGENLS